MASGYPLVTQFRVFPTPEATSETCQACDERRRLLLPLPSAPVLGGLVGEDSNGG